MPPSVKTTALITAGLGSFLAPFMVAGLIVALPAIAGEFSLDAVSLSWLTSIFFLSSAAFLIPVGRLADIWGVKKVFAAGVSLYVITAIICGVAPNFGVLMTGRFLTGIGGAAVFSTSIALITHIAPGSERGRSLGIIITAMVSGFSLGFLAGGLLSFYLGWRSIFLVTIPLAMVSAFMIFRIPGDCALAHEKRPDWTGMALSCTGILLLMSGLSAITGTIGQGLFFGGCILTGAFVVWEIRSESPLLDLRTLIRNPVFLLANLTVFLFYTGGFASIFLLSLHLQLVRGLDARLAGLILLVQPVMMTLAFYGGRLADRFSPWKIAGAGAVLSVIPMAYFIFLDGNTPIAGILSALAALGIGVALFQPSVAKAVVSSVGPAMYGLASGTVETMRLTGNTISTTIASIAFTLFLGTTQVARQNTGVFTSTVQFIFLVYTLITVTALFTVVPLMQACRRGKPQIPVVGPETSRTCFPDEKKG